MRVLQQRTPDTDQIRFARTEQLFSIGNVLDAAGQQNRNGNTCLYLLRHGREITRFQMARTEEKAHPAGQVDQIDACGFQQGSAFGGILFL